ncbi:MAG: hypothetical protein HKP57_04690 [Halobacteria archaeon]|nr:hypothetical protein [Halobacteria archaeon]
MASPRNSQGRRHRRAALVLACALSLPVATPAQAAMDDMFSVMFRMMLVMANVMSDAMLGNTGNNWGGLNSFNAGMTTMPMMSGFGSPWNSFGGTPWNSFGGTPWNSYGGGTPWNRYGIPRGAPANRANLLLQGRWFGNSGEILEISGNRFRLRSPGASLAGIVRINGNVINMFSPQTNTVTRYTFLQNQSELLLNDGSGVLLSFRKHPANALRNY